LSVHDDAVNSEHSPSRAAAARLSLYLRCLETWQREGVKKTSSGKIATTLGIRDAQVRKDLSSLGNHGQPGVGYHIEALAEVIRHVLGLDRRWPTAVIGVGNLARALLRYTGFREQGFEIVALFDCDPAKIGHKLDGITIQSIDSMPTRCDELKIEIGLLSVPAEVAQATSELMIQAGIRGILNFAPKVLRLPPEVSLVNVDLTIQLEQLAFQLRRGE
jgi:redox-sensing transcriptional repressor